MEDETSITWVTVAEKRSTEVGAVETVASRNLVLGYARYHHVLGCELASSLLWPYVFVNKHERFHPS